MKSLLEKQWRENRGYLAVFLAWMLIAVCYCIGYELGFRYRASVGQFSGFALLYSVCAAILLAMRTAQGEQSAGTLSFSASLPVSLRRIAAMRLAGAVVTLAIPILAAAVLLSCVLASGAIEQAQPRNVGHLTRLPLRETASVLTGLEHASGLLWFGQRMPYVQLAYGVLLPQSLAVDWGYGTEQGHYTDHELASYRWLAMVLAIPLLVGLGNLFTIHYGSLRATASDWKPWRVRFAVPPLMSHLPFHWPRRLLALIWLELRQSVPLAACGLLLAALMAFADILMEGNRSHSRGVSWLAQMPGATGIVATLWAVVVGSSLYAAELGSGLGAFWRSRPISPRMWFWCKFLVGLLAVLIVLDGLTILLTWNAPRDSPTTGMSWTYVACIPILHAFLYTLSVLGTCWLRRPVIGGFLAILGFALLTVGITTFPGSSWLDPINVYNALLDAERAGQTDFTRHGYPLVYGVLSASIVILALLASRLAKPLQPARRWYLSAAREGGGRYA